ncbi:hypothetical protein BC936DRAFT_149470 [Jimgerdemannia flammicorona]|uniref:Uncharacterized protein n=1 Tax=Jimgerdemannia flammicorona TaxID=994334 RepID=A0A433D0S2_9FUNG|nr:hypothetical protein BC936DRAFT_149470 [Jimgerdemannia flammicorona]
MSDERPNGISGSWWRRLLDSSQTEELPESFQRIEQDSNGGIRLEEIPIPEEFRFVNTAPPNSNDPHEPNTDDSVALVQIDQLDAALAKLDAFWNTEYFAQAVEEISDQPPLAFDLAGPDGTFRCCRDSGTDGF